MNKRVESGSFAGILDCPERRKRQQRIIWTALILLFYLPGDYWLYIIMITVASLSGRRIPPPVFLWLGWNLLATVLAPGFFFPPGPFLMETVIILGAVVTGLFMQRQQRVNLVIVSMIPFPMLLSGLFQILNSPFSSTGWLSPEQRGLITFRITGTLGNPNLFGVVLAFILPLVLTAAETGKGMKKYFLYAAGLFYAVALLLTFSRTAWLALAVAVLVLWGKEKKTALFRLAMLVFIFFFCFQPLQVRLFPPGGLERDSTVEYRRQVWETSRQLIKENPLTGVGSGGFKRRYLSLQQFSAAHAHNQFLQTAVEKGIPGLILLGWIIYCGLFKRAGTREKEGVRAALFGQLAAGLTESPWVHPLPLFLFWFGWAFLQEETDG